MIPYEHKYESIAEAPHMSFETAVTICRDAFYGLNTLYGTLFDDMLKNGQLDVYPKPGKRGGAFMSSGVNQPTLVFLNHTNTFKSLETLAHEMGHAMHTLRSKTQPVLYEDYSTTTAETASTFFENLVFEALIREATPAQKKVLLHDKITRDIATIQRQIAFFNFELELHERVRAHGAVTKEELREMMQRHLSSYLGKHVLVRKEDGYSFVYVSHFRYGFYVYTYTYGLLMSSLMHLRLKEDPGYAREIDTFLTSGGKAPVEEIFKSIGIDPSRVETFNEALKLHKNDIAEFKKLTQ
jgi:oligoendopeptidase F